MRLLIALLFISTTFYSQSNTEIFLLDIKSTNEKIELVNLKNISKSEGYDNQPSFLDANTILFSSTRNGQIDIRSYNINKQELSWLSNTSSSNEYSPLKIPNKEAISAIRLDKSGLQRLYEYNIVKGTSQLILNNLKVGYHVWFNQTILVSSVLVDDEMDLVVSNLKDNTNLTVYKNVGRSLHKIPNSDLIGFISYENESSTIKSLNPISGELKVIKSLPLKIKDICWLTENTILIPDRNMIAQVNSTNGDISILHNFAEDEINEISRISVSANGKHLVLVSEESPKILVKKHIEALKNKDLRNCTACYANNVVVKNYPNDTLYVGKTKLISNYDTFFTKSSNININIQKRMNKGNIVIHEELINTNGKEKRQVVIYEIKNGAIVSMTLIHEKEKLPEAEILIEQQLDALNSRDIDTFIKTFSDDIKAYDFPNRIYADGKKQLKNMFIEFFSQTPDLYSEVKNRIVIGNIVIDDEMLIANGDNFNSIAIYEIKNGKISKLISVR